MARTRGCDHRLAAAGGHLRGARCHPPGGGGPWGEARGREDHGGEQPADDQGHEGAGGGGEGREGPPLGAGLWRLRADVPVVGLDRSQQDQGDLRPRRADDHAAEGGDGQAPSDHGGSHATEGVAGLTYGGGGRPGWSPSFSSGGDMVSEHRRSMEGLLTHVGTADCFITLPHPALECGIVTAWWQCQVEANTAMRGAARGRATAAATSGASLTSASRTLS